METYYAQSMEPVQTDDNIAIYEDPEGFLHFLPCDESQTRVQHILDKTCFCMPKEEKIDTDRQKSERVWIHNKILH